MYKARHPLRWSIHLAAVASVFSFSNVLAQESATDVAEQEPETDRRAIEEIVVTGTLIRGVAPVGSQAIGITQEQITSVGASNTSQLLASVPQAGFFLQEITASSRKSVNRPNLRNIGNTSSASPSSLVLLDGHRLPGMGVRQVSPDIDAIAPGAIERIEIVTDGGSALYGSDAVAGVLNIITHRRFDGVNAKLRYGHGSDYDTWDTSITAGRDWGTVSAYVSYNYARREVEGQRDYVRDLDWINMVPRTTTCDPGNITFTGFQEIYALPGLTPGLGNRCDIGGLGKNVEDRHSAYASMVIDNGGPVTFSVKSFYMNRGVDSLDGPLAGSVTLAPTNPFYMNVPGRSGNQTVQFNTLSALNQFTSTVDTESWGLTPAMDVDLGAGWNLNAFYNYGVGTADYNSQILNASLLQQLTTQGQFDPINLVSPFNRATLAEVTDWFDFGWARDEIHNVRTVIDGPLLELPAGDVRIAAGAELMLEEYKSRILQGGNAATISSLPKLGASRDVKSLFGELYLPILDASSGIVHSLDVSVAGRYDEYSDVGSTFNPKIGVNLAPVEWLTFRGNWGESFQAPSLADSSIFTPPNLINLNAVRFDFGLTPLPGQITQIALQGVVDPLKPQTATTYSFGFDLRPPVVEGLALGATYYHIKFKDQLSITPWYLPNARELFPALIHVNPGSGDAEFAARVAELAELSTNPSALLSIPIENIFSIVDGRNRNLSAVDVEGVDFYLSYQFPTSFGDIFVSSSGNYILDFTRQDFVGAPTRDTTGINESRFRLSTALGTNVGNLLAQVRWSHQGGFKVTPSAANLQQSRVDDFNVFDIFFQYNIPGEGLVVTLNIDNAFDTAPPRYRGNLGIEGAGPGYANGYTLGRVFKLGIEKMF